MDVPDAVGRLCGLLPEWACYFVRLGAQSVGVEPGLTLVVSVPRRECVAGLIAAGAVLSLEEMLWSVLAKDPGQNLQAGDHVVVIREPWCKAGHVLATTDSEVKVRMDCGVFTYKDNQRCAVVPCRPDLSGKERIRVDLTLLRSKLFLDDRFRAISFVLREIEGCQVTGPKNALLDEWGKADLIDEEKRRLSIHSLLAPLDGRETLHGTHIKLTPDSEESVLAERPSKGLHIIDGYRRWCKVRRDSATGCRIVVIDRTDDRSYLEAWHTVREDLGAFVSIGNDPPPPKGIEAFAYRPPGPASW